MVENSRDENVTQHYCRTFGAIALAKGFVTPEYLKEAVEIQTREDLEARQHRLIGSILFSLDMITADQINEVLNELFHERGTGIPL